jgi:hypothetical protein
MNLILQAIKSIFRKNETRFTDVETRITDAETKLTDVETRLTDALPLIVHLSYDGEVRTADVSYSEIFKAVQSGRKIIVHYNNTNEFYTYIGIHNEMIAFGRFGYAYSDSRYCMDVYTVNTNEYWQSMTCLFANS